MTKRKYFFSKASGLNNDLQRHRAHEQKLLAQITELENKDRDEFEESVLRAFHDCMGTLQASKAEILTKLGRK